MGSTLGGLQLRRELKASSSGKLNLFCRVPSYHCHESYESCAHFAVVTANAESKTDMSASNSAKRSGQKRPALRGSQCEGLRFRV